MRYAWLPVLCALLFLGFGCGPTISESIVESAANRQLDGSGSIDVNDETVTYRGENDEFMTFGDNVAIPDDFPKDLPVYPDTKVFSVLQDGTSASITLSTEDSAEKVTAWYKDRLSAWTKSGEMNATNYWATFFENDDAQMSVTIGVGDDDETNTIVVTRTTK